MYPSTRNGNFRQYDALPTERPLRNDGSSSQFYNPPPPSSFRTRLGLSTILKRRRRYKSTSIALFVIIFVLLCIIFNNLLKSWLDDPVRWSPGDFVFTDPSHPRPAYLDKSLPTPLRIRLAIMSRVDEFERRQVSRDAVLSGIPSGEVQIEYKFFVGRTPRSYGSVKGWYSWVRLGVERWVYGDVVVLQELNDVPQRLSEKRYMALQWTASVPHHKYDYSMTMDSDTFCRFRTLARRLRHEFSELRPLEQPILIGRMGGHLVYLKNTVPDGNINDEDEDFVMKGPWYSYPLGIGYMLSSNITETIFTADPPLPHHINYPSDDVMIGAWVAGLKLFHDPTILFETTLEHSPPPQHRVYPEPYFPYAVDTKVIDDKIGWHDFKNRGANEGPIGWETACVHRMSPKEMRAFREMEEIRQEWDNS